MTKKGKGTYKKVSSASGRKKKKTSATQKYIQKIFLSQNELGNVESIMRDLLKKFKVSGKASRGGQVFADLTLPRNYPDTPQKIEQVTLQMNSPKKLGHTFFEWMDIIVTNRKEIIIKRWFKHNGRVNQFDTERKKYSSFGTIRTKLNSLNPSWVVTRDHHVVSHSLTKEEAKQAKDYRKKHGLTLDRVHVVDKGSTYAQGLYYKRLANKKKML